jgi:ABC-type transport system involved in multi-copper enzyme maturation permease subunit
MRLRANQYIALAGLTALETVRQPICLILTATCIVFVGVLPVVLTHSLGESARLVSHSALAFHFVGGLVLGGYAACATLTHEIRRGTAAAVLSKPVERTTFFLSKFLGIAIVVLLFSIALTLACLLSVRTVHDPYTLDLFSQGALLAAVFLAFAVAGLLNYTLRRPFCSNAFVLMLVFLLVGFVTVNFLDAQGKAAPFGSRLDWDLLPANVLVGMGILVLAGISVGLATRLDMVATLTICSIVFLLGLMSDYLFGRAADHNMIAFLLYYALPNWQNFWVVDALSEDKSVSVTYLLTVGQYGLLYLGGVLCLGLLAFKKVEVRA